MPQFLQKGLWVLFWLTVYVHCRKTLDWKWKLKDCSCWVNSSIQLLNCCRTLWFVSCFNIVSVK